MNLFKRLKTYFLFKNSPKKNEDVTYGSELEIYDADIVYTNRYQDYTINNNDILKSNGVKFLSNIIIEISLNPDTIYCQEYFTFLNMLSIGSIRYTHIKNKRVLLLYISTNVFDLESLLCANIESSNVLIETIVSLLGRLPIDGFSRIISKNIISEGGFSYTNNINYDGYELLKPYKDFQTAINRYNPDKTSVQVIEIDHLEYAMEKHIPLPAIRLSNIIFISHLNLDVHGYKFKVKDCVNYGIYVYSIRIDDFINEIINSNNHVILCADLFSTIYDENIENYFNIDKEKDGVNIFNITPINLERVNYYRDYMETDYDDNSEDEDSPGETSDYEYQSFYEGVDEVLSEDEIKEAEEYAAKVNKQAEIQMKM